MVSTNRQSWSSDGVAAHNDLIDQSGDCVVHIDLVCCHPAFRQNGIFMRSCGVLQNAYNFVLLKKLVIVHGQEERFANC